MVHRKEAISQVAKADVFEYLIYQIKILKQAERVKQKEKYLGQRKQEKEIRTKNPIITIG